MANRYKRWDDRIENVRRFLVRNANERGAVCLTDVSVAELNILGMTERGLNQFVRINQEALGGEYFPSKKRIGDPRAFNCDERQTRWTYATFRLRSLAGKPLIEIL